MNVQLFFFFLAIFLSGTWASAQDTPKPNPTQKIAPPSYRSPFIQRAKRFRSRTCKSNYYRAKNVDIPRWKKLVQRLSVFQCDEAQWKTCQAKKEEEVCKDKEVIKRWDACFRIDRRLFVITQRLQRTYATGRKNRCRWKLSLSNERFQKPRFSPDPERYGTSSKP